ncbi:MAG: hypothetical protein M1294_00050 [Firmicutes bacterium]|uniref:Uncharacterized protein n=1 Tax=Sulfobacillus benefaciens TaxID=453960 RepID=A0A2T2X753_9FIRM|nr:hypothetical protein [Bacillota bacterium]PSR30331.1 MAG: hypothetical protein C7B43_06340 [Sulfobacillus benefaciens]HBQ95067.1 hypothetical protein [Sulfobacillus sp.]
MARIFGWFNNTKTLLSCLDKIRNRGMVSLLLRESNDSVVVVGPIVHNFSTYPFLDLPHHIRLLGLARPWAEKYARVIAKGGIVVCVDMEESNDYDKLRSYPFHDLKLVPTPGQIKPTALAVSNR